MSFHKQKVHSGTLLAQSHTLSRAPDTRQLIARDGFYYITINTFIKSKLQCLLSYLLTGLSVQQSYLADNEKQHLLRWMMIHDKSREYARSKCSQRDPSVSYGGQKLGVKLLSWDSHDSKHRGNYIVAGSLYSMANSSNPLSPLCPELQVLLPSFLMWLRWANLFFIILGFKQIFLPVFPAQLAHDWWYAGTAISFSMHSICNFPLMLSDQSGWLKQPTPSTAPISILLISLHQWVKNNITSRFHNLDFKHYKVLMQETFLVLYCKCKLWACRLVFGCHLLVVSIKEDLPSRIISIH